MVHSGNLDDAAVVGELAQLTAADLPLAPGLRAMAAETPRRRAAKAIERIAQRLDQGTPLAAAVEAEGSRFPPYLRGLLLAATRCGDVGSALQGLVALEQKRTELRRRVWLSLAYPLMLWGIGFAILVLELGFLVPPFESVFKDFGTDLPALTMHLISLSHAIWPLTAVVCLVVAAWAMVAVTGRPLWGQRLADRIPLVGTVWRWHALAEFSRLLALMLDQRVPLPEALQWIKCGLRRPDLRIACGELAERLSGGMSLSAALAESPVFPQSLQPFVEWGQRNACLADAFRGAAEVFEGRVRLYTAVLERIATPLAFVLVWLLAVFMAIGLTIPLIPLVQKLW